MFYPIPAYSSQQRLSLFFQQKWQNGLHWLIVSRSGQSAAWLVLINQVLAPKGAVHPVSKAALNWRSLSSSGRGAAADTSPARLAAAQGNCRSRTGYTRRCGCVPVDTATVCVLYSINFNQDASLICVSSDHGTVHIFAAEDPKRNKQSR